MKQTICDNCGAVVDEDRYTGRLGKKDFIVEVSAMENHRRGSVITFADLCLNCTAEVIRQHLEEK